MLNGLIPIFLMFVPQALIVYGLVFLKNRRASKRRSPLSSELLRSPGESLRLAIDNVNLDLMAYLALAPLLPLLLYSTYLSILYFGPSHKIGWVSITFYILLGLGSLLYLTNKLWQLGKLRNKLTLGYEAELAVAQELNLLAHDGYWVFHDFPATNFNIDHIAVGPAGVFAIETKGRSKPINDKGKAEWVVNYDGTTLNFPGWIETEALRQAQRQSDWLQDWLSGAVGESVKVKPILILPGWYVKETGGNGIMVLSGKNSSGRLKGTRGMKLSEKLIKQITHQLDQRCRTVSPRAYATDKRLKPATSESFK